MAYKGWISGSDWQNENHSLWSIPGIPTTIDLLVFTKQPWFFAKGFRGFRLQNQINLSCHALGRLEIRALSP